MGSSVPKRRFVLVVEDDTILRMNALDMFEDAGLAVLEAANADDALRLLELHGPEVAALFTDVNMDGLELAKAVFERRPHILPVVTSGREPLRDADIPDGGRFVAKPYRLAEVVDTVRQSLA